jgi:hypothetical protein
LDGCTYLDLPAQIKSNIAFAAVCPTSHYARKNVGYLAAIINGAEIILETDDDNIPRENFFDLGDKQLFAHTFENGDWVNVYRFFCEGLIWPRGLPLTSIHNKLPAIESLPEMLVNCPIQQGLADENPDVDAIYRLILPLPQSFSKNIKIALGENSWCPFNSQNTAWWSDAFPLLYLPAYCSFRMTDIWRSFVAQRIAWENGWHILFHAATVWQERNKHNLLKDFSEEIPGYLNNTKIADTLKALPLKSGGENIFDNMRNCYKALVDLQVVGAEELKLLDVWLADITRSGWLERQNKGEYCISGW